MNKLCHSCLCMATHINVCGLEFCAADMADTGQCLQRISSGRRISFTWKRLIAFTVHLEDYRVPFHVIRTCIPYILFTHTHTHTYT